MVVSTLAGSNKPVLIASETGRKRSSAAGPNCGERWRMAGVKAPRVGHGSMQQAITVLGFRVLHEVPIHE